MKSYIIGIMIVSLISLTILLAGCQGVAPIEDIGWKLTAYGQPANMNTVLPDTEPTARFNSETRELRGSGGCNTFFGAYEVDGNDLIMEGPFAVTEMWCGEETGQQESEYLDILLAADSYEIEDGTLTIYSGENVLVFEES